MSGFAVSTQSHGYDHFDDAASDLVSRTDTLVMNKSALCVPTERNPTGANIDGYGLH